MVAVISKRLVLPCLVAVMLLLTVPVRGLGSFTTSDPFADVGRRPPVLTEVYRYTDGIDVQVSEVWAGRRLGVPVVELAVTLSNGSMHTFEALLSGELRYGPHHLTALRYQPRPWPDDSGSMQLIAIGEQSTPYRLSFVVPSAGRDDLELDLAIDAGAHDPAVFVGGVSE